MASTLWNPHMPHSSNGTATSVTRRRSPAGHLRDPEQPERHEQRAHHQQDLLGAVERDVLGPPTDLLGEVTTAGDQLTDVLTQTVSDRASTRQTPAASCSAREYGAGVAGAIGQDSIVWDMANLSQKWNVPDHCLPDGWQRTWCNRPHPSPNPGVQNSASTACHNLHRNCQCSMLELPHDQHTGEWQTLSRVSSSTRSTCCIQTQLETSVQLLGLVAEFAHQHDDGTVDPITGPAARSRTRQSGSVARAPRWSPSSHPRCWPPGWVSPPMPGRGLVADVLDLEHRLPMLVSRVRASRWPRGPRPVRGPQDPTPHRRRGALGIRPDHTSA